MRTNEEEPANHIDELVHRLEALPDPACRETAQSLIESILALHGRALERMMEVVFDSGESGQAIIRRLASDDLVSNLLVLHGLHPDSMETRAQRALAKIHASAELRGVFDDVVRVRLTGSACGLRDAVNTALLNAVPDAVEILIEESAGPSAFVPLEALAAAVPERAT